MWDLCSNVIQNGTEVLKSVQCCCLEEVYKFYGAILYIKEMLNDLNFIWSGEMLHVLKFRTMLLPGRSLQVFMELFCTLRKCRIILILFGLF